MKDQYDNEVPGRLVIISGAGFFDMLSEEDVKEVEGLDWFECDGFLLADGDTLAANWIEDYTEPPDAGLVIGPKSKILKVNDCLKRWSEEDGFYHV